MGADKLHAAHAMTSRWIGSLILGLLIGVAGVGTGLVPFGHALEEDLGLELLFALRGTRAAPPEVVVVSVDKASSDRMNLPNDLRKWPRSLHARLTDVLSKRGAAVIVFDIFFEDPRDPSDDERFAESIRRAGNVVLCERLQTDRLSMGSAEASPATDIGISKLVSPLPSFANSAAAKGPFPLPKVPIKVSKSWTFKTGAGDTPTLPVVAFQRYAMPAYGEFLRLVQETAPSYAGDLPPVGDFAERTGETEKVILTLRNMFENDPEFSEKMLVGAENPRSRPGDPEKSRRIRSLVGMYRSDQFAYLNFYGPPRTIATIPYIRALELGESAASEGKTLDVKGKAVFVGSSETLQHEQKDSFHTVFTQSNGLDLSGVEIAATAFANLLESAPLRPASIGAHVAVLFLWGLGIGILCRMLSPLPATASSLGLGILYVAAARYLFASTSWYPVIVPVFLQAPTAVVAGMVWKYLDVKKERQNIRAAFQHYLPNDVVDRLAKNLADLKAGDQLVYGTCLATDAEQYTSLSESMGPQELGEFMNRYYETVFGPVKKHRGAVSNVVGDSMLAIWASTNPESSQRNRACLAALDIAAAIRQADAALGSANLATRIGLHSGRILLGNLGAIDHYEYRPVGDIVNTATRIEGLNKHLGTRILASDEVVDRLDGFLTREIGTFRLVGKAKPIVVHELLCRMEDADERLARLCGKFAEALERFRSGSFGEAMEKFREAGEAAGGDGPSVYYLKLCRQYCDDPPVEDSWGGVIRMSQK